MRLFAPVLLGLTILIAAVAPAMGAGTPGGWSGEQRLTVQFPASANGLMTDVSDSGYAIAAWNCFDQTLLKSVAWVALYDPAKGWTGGTLLDGSAHNSIAESVAINDNGTAVASWVRTQNGIDTPMAAVYEAASGWQARTVLSTENADAIYDLDVALNERGEAIAAWDATIGSSYYLMASTYKHSSGWSGASPLISSTYLQLYPMAGISDRGDGMVAWKEQVELPGPIYTGVLRYSSYDPTTGWSTQAVVNNDDVGLGSPVAHMEMNGQGQALLAYSCPVAASTTAESRAAYYDGHAWLPAVTLSDEDDNESACPDVGLNDDGWGMVVWAQWKGGITEYQYREFENGAFGPLSVIPHVTVVGMNWPYIDVSENRNVIATTYVQLDGDDEQHAYAVRYSPSTGWSQWERLDGNSFSSVFFLVRGGIDNEGRAVVAWISHDDSMNTNLSVWASAYSPATVEPQPVDYQGQIDALKGQLDLAIIVAGAAIALAVASMATLFWRTRRK